MNTTNEIIHMAQLGPQIAAELGPEWTAHSSDETSWRPSVTLSRADGASIYIVRDRKDTRLVISGEYPHDYSREVLDITVGIKYPPVTIAGQIRRRLLPEYLPAYALAVERKTRADTNEAARLAALQKLADIAGEPINANSGKIYFYAPLGLEDKSWSEIELGGADYGKFEISNAPLALIEKLLRVVMDLKKEAAKCRTITN